MNWIFLSPHLDDAVFSCGGLIWDLSNSGQQVEIWTICAGDPPPGSFSALASFLHKEWGLGENAYQVRRQEDLAACRILGAAPRHFSYLDCIYRRGGAGEHLYDSPDAIFGGLDPGEASLIDQLTAELDSILPPGARVISPLGIGNHVDHELTRKAASRLSAAAAHYPDYPYAREEQGREILRFLGSSPDWSREQHPVTRAGQEKWFEASRAYASQLPTFWKDEEHLRSEIHSYADFLGGVQLWNTVPGD